MGSIGAPELIIILVAILLLFGASRLPRLARSLGQASKEFKRGVAEEPNDDEAVAKKSEPAALEAKETPNPT